MIDKIIKDEKSYEAALNEINRLIDLDPIPGTPEADQLELLSLLIENYETNRFPRNIPDPIEAIRFRMEQGNLSQKDLIQYIGSRSKVSEILSGKRPLSLSMIRALHNGLKIPAKVLLRDRSELDLKDSHIDWSRFPIKEMVARGWIKANSSEVRFRTEELARAFFAHLHSPPLSAVMYKATDYVRSGRTMDKYALAAWTIKIIDSARRFAPTTQYISNTVNLDFMREVTRLSWSESGPILAQEFLRQHGISLVVEPHLSRTYIDGAAIMVMNDHPIIGLSIRHNRTDSFWFTLMHELAHIALHYGQETNQFYDDLDIHRSDDPREQAADDLAKEALIPREAWEKSAARVLKSPEAAESLAKKLRIHPAIVAGRMRHEFNSYQILAQLVGQGQVRKLFKGVQW